MSTLAVNRTPNLIAAEINHIKDETQKVVIYNSIEIGRRLVEAKELVEHGEWVKWLETEVNYGKSTANNLMKIFKEYGADQMSLLDGNLKSQTFGNLSYSQAVTLLGVPSEERESFIQDNNIDDMSTRELKKAIADLKKAEKEKEEALKEVDKVREEVDKAKEEVQLIKEEKAILEEAFNSNAEDRNLLEEKFEELENKILERESEILKLKTQDLEINVDTEELEEKYKEELKNLKEDKENLQKEIEDLREGDKESETRFRVFFDDIVQDFNKLMQELATMKDTNEVQHMKFNSATKKFLSTMLDRL